MIEEIEPGRSAAEGGLWPKAGDGAAEDAKAVSFSIVNAGPVGLLEL